MALLISVNWTCSAAHQRGQVADRLLTVRSSPPISFRRVESPTTGVATLSVWSRRFFSMLLVITATLVLARLAASMACAGHSREGREFLVLRPLQVFDLLLQQGDIPLQFLDFLVGAGRAARDRQQEANQKASGLHTTLLTVQRGSGEAAPSRAIDSVSILLR